jgi:tetratricopeptide (TPR) repeat protein
VRSVPRPILAAVLLVGGVGAAARLTAPDRSRAWPGPSLAEERRIREADIAFFERRIERDPTGALDLVRLGGLLLARYRETGDEQDLEAAESAARRSLRNRLQRNAAAEQLLTAALLGQHRFLEAEAVARVLVTSAGDEGSAAAILGEVWLELGRYAAADSVFRSLLPRQYDPAIAPRLARWLELRGRPGEARRLLESARDAARQRPELTRADLAWYELRLGELALRYGARAEARRRLEAGLALVPDHWRLLAARARLALETGDAATAIALGDSSLARHLDPATLATVGDAWVIRRDRSRAEAYFRALESAARAPRGGFHRAWYLALLDHDRRVPEVLAAVRNDLETRPDIYGWDLLAWALYKSGQLPEAREAMARALDQGTSDPLLARHARVIAAAR